MTDAEKRMVLAHPGAADYEVCRHLSVKTYNSHVSVLMRLLGNLFVPLETFICIVLGEKKKNGLKKTFKQDNYICKETCCFIMCGY